ncbi:unnamed protein product [Larinioides sclopetarius]|uniref:G domain-containing protein n=1 Tax=Larinioides sclopetarius TaxID=280406 RepID=A0AAV2AA20_9ARAC
MTFQLLKRGEKEIQLKNQYKEVVLVAGETGNGKTTFSRWITEDDGQLVALETNEDSGDFIVQDIHGEANATITSDTVFPTLMVDTENNVPYYDCPGFNDTRSVCNDIATTFFIKTVVDYADSVKILFLINYPSLRKGLDRANFMKLMKHATELIKNVEKFENSVALIATKVDNRYRNGGTIFVDDNTVIAGIADFLEEVKNELAVQITNSALEKRRFYEVAIKLTSYFLKKDGEGYSNIGIFRRLEQSGSLNEFPRLLKGKENIKRIIYRNLTFTKKVEDDFGYTISLESMNVIGGLVEEINESVWRSAVNITDGIAEHFNTLINEVRKTIKSLHNACGSITCPKIV